MRARIQKISKHAPSIFQGRFSFALPGAPAASGISLTMEHPAERTAFKIFIAVLALLACGYVYFVGLTILNVIARKDALTQMSVLGNAVSDLEREYFAASQELGPEDGARLGLTPVLNTAYVHRPGNLSAGVPAQADAAAASSESNEI